MSDKDQIKEVKELIKEFEPTTDKNVKNVTN